MPGRCIVDAIVCPMDAPENRQEAICWNEDGVIQAVGSKDDVVAVAASLGIEPESMPGRTILPGFVDAHMHFFHVGVRKIRPDLRDAPSLEAALSLVAQWLKENPGDAPVIAEGWDESHWPENRFPSKDEVSSLEAAAGRPVVLRRMCGHFAVAGELALHPIRAHWDVPGLVDLGSGVLKEQPSLYLNEVFPVPDDALDEALQVATDIAHSLGVTCVGEYTQAPFRAALLKAVETDRLRIRIANHIYVQQLEDAIAAGFQTAKHRGPLFKDGGLKVFHDGSFGGRTAWLREPYQDDPSDPPTRGTPIWTDDEVDDWYQQAHAAGIQVTAHVIGDAAIDQGLDGYERLKDKADSGALPSWDGDDGGPNGLRHRFEHYELPHDDAVERTVAMGLVACAQPNFVGEWSAPGGMYHKRLGDVFLLNNRYRTFLDAGLQLCFGSDGMPFGPLCGIQAAIDHPIPEERLTVAEAVWLYTERAAWACHWDQETGSLLEGKQADALIIDIPDLDSTPPRDWIISETILGGETMHRGTEPKPHADMTHVH